MTPTLKQKGPTVYLLYFRKPDKHARHYLCYSDLMLIIVYER